MKTKVDPETLPFEIIDYVFTKYSSAKKYGKQYSLVFDTLYLSKEELIAGISDDLSHAKSISKSQRSKYMNLYDDDGIVTFKTPTYNGVIIHILLCPFKAQVPLVYELLRKHMPFNKVLG